MFWGREEFVALKRGWGDYGDGDCVGYRHGFFAGV